MTKYTRRFALSALPVLPAVLVAFVMTSCNRQEAENEQRGNAGAEVTTTPATQPQDSGAADRIQSNRGNAPSAPQLVAEEGGGQTTESIEVTPAPEPGPAPVPEHDSSQTTPTVEVGSAPAATPALVLPTVTPAPDVRSALAGTRQFLKTATTGEKSLPQQVTQPVSVQLENMSRMARQDSSYSAEQLAKIDQTVETVEKLLNSAVANKSPEQQSELLKKVQTHLEELENQLK